MALVDPATLTKEKLKKELSRHNVSLPSPSARKDVYINLYRTHVLTSRRSEFSSDDEDSLGTPRKQKSMKKKASSLAAPLGDVSSLSDKELAEQLKNHGVAPGPIIATTRKLYEKKLQRLLEDAQNGTTEVPPPEVKENDEEFSDQEEEEEPMPPPSRVSRASRYKTPATNVRNDRDSVDSPLSGYRTSLNKTASNVSSSQKSYTDDSQDTVILTDSSQDIFSGGVKSRTVTSTYSSSETTRSRKTQPSSMSAPTVLKSETTPRTRAPPTEMSKPAYKAPPISQAMPTPEERPKTKSHSILVQVVVLIVVIVLVYLIFQNMEGAFVNKVPEGLPK